MFISEDSLLSFGFKNLGKNVKLSHLASIYNAKNISIGDNVRIDDFCILSAGDEGIEIGNNVHISCYATMIGRGKITIGNYSNLSVKSTIFSSSDDFSGKYLTGATIPEIYTNVKHAPVTLMDHSLVGAGTIILPGVTMGIGSATGSLSLVNKDVDEFTIVAGIPAKFIKNRSKVLLQIQKQLEHEKYD